MRRLPLAFLPALLLLCACAAPVVKKQVLAPAAATEVARLTRLRVAPFDNDPGGLVRAAVEFALVSVVVDGRPYFTMVDAATNAGDLGKPMQWVDTAKTKARPIRYGAEGTVQGGVGQNGWHNEHYSERRRECVAEDDKGRCRFWSSSYITCTRRVALFSFTPKVVARDTGEVLLAQEFSESRQSSACPDNGSPTSGDILLAAAQDRAIARFRDHVAPHLVTLEIPLLTEDDSGMSAQVKTLVAGGVDFAKAGQTDKACRVWRSAAARHASGFALPYLSGVCAELEDNLDLAEGFYAQAEQRTARPVPEIAAALARLKATRASLDKLEHQLK
jgi:hypothetical protein